MRFRVDGALYPDRTPPTDLESLEDKVDYIARLCAAWDFGRLPDGRTVEEIRRPAWKPAVEATLLLTSPCYHLLRSWHALSRERYLGRELAYIRDDPSIEHV